MKSFILFLSAMLATSSLAFAEQFPAKGRVFLGGASTNPTELNTEMAAQNIKDYKNLIKYGADITYSLSSYLDVGLRYERIGQRNLEVTETAGQSFYSELLQDAVMGVARVPLLKSGFARADFFGAIGASSTTLTLKNATQDGKLTKANYSSPVAELGASIGFGYKNVFLYVEGGYSMNQVSSLDREGVIGSNVDKIDLSGSYVVIGLLFDGITATK